MAITRYNETTQLNVKVPDGYEEIYPKQLGEGIAYNPNTFVTNGRHIQIDSANVSDAIDEIKDRISQGGRIFSQLNFTMPSGAKFKKIIYANGKYYMLLNVGTTTTMIYESANLSTWNRIVNSSSALLSDMTNVNGTIFLIGFAISSNLRFPAVYKLSNDSLVVVKSSTDRFYGTNINTNAYISSDTCSAMGVVAGYNNDIPADIMIKFNYIASTDTWDISTKFISGYGNLKNLVNVGNNKYLLGNDKDMWLSHFDPINKCVYGYKDKAIYRLEADNNFSPTRLATFDMASAGNCFDILYVNGRYVYNGYDAINNTAICEYGIYPYNNNIPAQGKRIMDQALCNISYEGQYVFASGSEDGKIYYSLVK